MKKLPLKNPAFEFLEKGFSQWLDIMGYCDQVVYNMPHSVREFLHHLEKLQVKSINSISQSHIKSYHAYIISRPHDRRGGALSDKYILMHLQSIEKFLEYLHYKGVTPLPTMGIRLSQVQRKEVLVLTQQEIKLLFETASKESDRPQQEVINARDRAMLVVYYSCGLRRNEGISLSVDDINFDTRILHVRKGKNYKERLVPFNKTSAQILEVYVYDHRTRLVQSKKESALFISAGGKPTTGGTLYNRLKLLQVQSDDAALQQKTIGLHTLRHSIATHLLEAGMQLERIAKFLGHSSLESTQIYTHLADQQKLL